MKYIPMTIDGEKKLRKKLKHLKNKKRKQIIKSISEARKFGDLKENSEYHSAKEEQILCEKKIIDIENKLLNALIIDTSKINNKQQITFGSTITILNLKNQKISKYKIVGDDESNIKKKLISISCPLSRGLIGKKTHEITTIKTPNGNIKYKIINIK